MNVNELMNELLQLNKAIGKLVEKTEIDTVCDMSAVDRNYDNPEELLLADELCQVMLDLESAARVISYLSKPIKATGILHKNRNGRYECDYHEFTCGNSIEYYTYDYDTETYKWIISRVEHDGNDYYIVGSRRISKDSNPIPMNGLKVRFR
jgi:hypothetical protein